MALNPADQELVEIGVNALRSKDFPTVLATYQVVRPLTGGVLPELNPDIAGALYIAVMKRLDPRFDTLRGEWDLFLAWLREQEALEAAEGLPGAVPGAE